MSGESGPDHPPYCSVCGEPPVIKLRYPERHLCAGHFTAEVLVRVEKTIRAHGMIEDGDRIAVAFSGGKDSTALLILLSELLLRWDDVTITAVTVDEGIAGYRDETVRAAQAIADRLGIRHSIVSFSAIYGKGLDSILAGREERACSICGILRRRALFLAAQEAGATKLATGHNLDDEAQSVLMNVLRGDLPRLVRDSGAPSHENFLPRIKPLREITEKEIAVFLMVRDCFLDLPQCPYTRYALRAEVRSHVCRLEYQQPGTMRKLILAKTRLTRALSGVMVSGGLTRCRICGEPCSGTVCQTCGLIASFLD